MRMRGFLRLLGLGLLASLGGGHLAAAPLLECRSGAQFAQAFTCLDGDFRPTERWTVTGPGLELDAPVWRQQPAAALDLFEEFAETYWLYRYLPMWRYALAGEADWRDYTVEVTLRIKRPAPPEPYRAGSCFVNYQWGRENPGLDAGVIVRYQDPTHFYMVRVSSQWGHLELWKTWGGIVQVQPYPVKLGEAQRLRVTASRRWIVVEADGKERLRYYDPELPLTSGRVGLAVRESHTEFTDFSVQAAEPIRDRAPEHVPDFQVRSWVGFPCIFDGAEPIGRVEELWEQWRQYGETRLVETKLRPGQMPVLLMGLGTVNYGAAFAWRPGQLEVLERGPRLRFRLPLEERRGRGTMVVEMTVTYEPERGYIWDKRIEMSIAEGAKVTTKSCGGLLDDPWYYLLREETGARMGRRPTCMPPHYPWIVWQAPEGELRKATLTPMAAYGYSGVPGNPERMAPAGFLATVLTPEAAAVMDFPEIGTGTPDLEVCVNCLDLHVSVQDPALPQYLDGYTYRGRIRHYAWTREEIAAYLESARINAPPTDSRGVVYHEPLNDFQKTVSLTESHPYGFWRGRFRHDPETGRGDQACLKLVFDERARGVEIVGRKSADVKFMDWTGPYLAPRYRIRAWVKPDAAFRGKAELIVNLQFMKIENGRQVQSRLQQELVLEGAQDWTPVEIVTDQVRLARSGQLEIAAEDDDGEGTLWIDDVSIEPLD